MQRRVFFRYRFANKAVNNIAVIKLTQTVPNAEEHILRLCNGSFRTGIRLGTCGMGSLSGKTRQYPSYLWEAPFAEVTTIPFTWNHKISPHMPRTPLPRVLCRNDVICSRPLWGRSNICFKDEGSPLYALDPCGATSEVSHILNINDCIGS